ncbi:hypothetical protein DKX38_020552 [Salix brachista]|uniref:EF-hand domain-containing protein n=1 Tax=Salix brachista TaxID=2182728 RepID=A0A5N5KAX2_9ROSI|nr:hypothetical protein DKX38_020552 [Salix brachista]
MFPSTHRLKNIDKGCGKPVTLASPLDEEQLNKIFDRFDSNGDGHLSWEELKSAYNSLVEESKEDGQKKMNLIILLLQSFMRKHGNRVPFGKSVVFTSKHKK